MRSHCDFLGTQIGYAELAQELLLATDLGRVQPLRRCDWRSQTLQCDFRPLALVRSKPKPASGLITPQRGQLLG
jgi:hypothetical protein